MADSTCSAEGCERPRTKRDWCNAHYKRWLRWGDPVGKRAMRGDAPALFWSQVMQPSEECRLWPFGTSGGYGQIKTDDGPQLIHRLTCTLWHGPRPVGADAAHSCGNRLCWAGEHLRWATRQSNVLDRQQHGTWGLRLSTDDVLAIRSSGMTRRQLAERFGVSPKHIQRVRNGGAWKWL